jgi:hypothetical protein
MKKVIAAALLAFSFGTVHAQSTVKTSAQEVATPEMAQQREVLKKAIVAKYLDVKQCLIVSDSVQAAKSAAGLVISLNQFKFKKLGLQEMNEATTMRGKLKGLAQQIAETQSINKQRNYFMELSEGMWTIISKVVPEKTALYEQKCPMTGKVWISDVKDIKNPYFPKNMLTCGEVTAAVGVAL